MNRLIKIYKVNSFMSVRLLLKYELINAISLHTHYIDNNINSPETKTYIDKLIRRIDESKDYEDKVLMRFI